GIQPASLLQHLSGKVDPEYGDVQVTQVARDVSRTTTQVAHLASSCNCGGETFQKFLVERLVLKLVRDPARIFIRNAVVALANAFSEVVLHYHWPQAGRTRTRS